MASSLDAGGSLREPAIVVSPAGDLDISRGRKRCRSKTRSSNIKSLRTDESSTLRGRSPRRASSPFGLLSRNSSPSVMSPTSQMLRYNQLRSTRREHCPSRTGTPSEQRPFRRRQRTRSRSRGPRDKDPNRAVEVLSSLRNEVLLHDDEDDSGHDEEK